MWEEICQKLKNFNTRKETWTVTESTAVEAVSYQLPKYCINILCPKMHLF
jgi:hypothetical protein